MGQWKKFVSLINNGTKFNSPPNNDVPASSAAVITEQLKEKTTRRQQTKGMTLGYWYFVYGYWLSVFRARGQTTTNELLFIYIYASTGER